MKAILDNYSHLFAIRGITRDLNSEKSKALVEKGVEMINANTEDFESLKKAFAGSYGAFIVTDYNPRDIPNKETQKAKNMAEAAKVNSIQNYIKLILYV